MRRWGYRLPHDTIGRTLHTAGTSPFQGSRLPITRVLVIEERTEGLFLKRFSSSREFAGDTWHGTLGDALHQAEFEFGAAPGDWAEIPNEEVDPIAYLDDPGSR